MAIRTASSVSATFITGITGPKVSSVITFIEWSASAITVGSYQSPGPSLRLPPVRTLAPLRRASSTWSATISAWAGVVIAPTSAPKERPSVPWRSFSTCWVSLSTNSS